MGPSESSQALRGGGERRPHHGRYIAAVAVLSGFAYSVRINSIYGLFLTEIGTAFGMSRTAVTGVQSLGRLVEGATAPVVGSALDRYGARWIMFGGLTLVLVAYGLTAVVQDWLQFYVLHGILAAIGFGMAGQLTSTQVIATWFIRLRGRINGLNGSASALGWTVMPPLVALLIVSAGWRTTWVLIGIFVWLVAAIPALVLLRRRPEDMGLLPDGEFPDTDPGSSVSPGAQAGQPEAALGPASGRLVHHTGPSMGAQDVHWTRAEALRTPVFWLLIFAMSLAGLGAQGANLHIIPLITDQGYSVGVAAVVVSLRSASAMVISPVWGWLLDRVTVRVLLPVQMALMAAGLLVVGTAGGLPQLVTGYIIYGMGLAGQIVSQGTIWPNFFGRASLGTVRGLSMPIVLGFSAGGPVYMGLLYDLTNSYFLPLVLLSGLFVVSGSLMVFASPPRKQALVQASP